MARVSRIALDMALEASKTLNSALRIAWQYAKIEIVPPLTLNFFHGPKGKHLESTISKAADNFIEGIKNRIHEIELNRIKEIKRKKAAAMVLVEKVKVEAKRKAEEAHRKAHEIAKKVKADAQKKVQVATKAVSDGKKKAKDEKEIIKKKVETAIAKKTPTKKGTTNKKGSES